MVMTDLPVERDQEEMLTTGAAAKVIGYGTTRKQVIAMIAAHKLPAVRLGRGQWAKVPLSAALAKRRELEEQLRVTEAHERAAEERERERTPPE